jgi:hypothetical protein
MGQTIRSVTEMVSYAGDLRRAAGKTPDADTAAKIQRSAEQLEKTAIARVSDAGPAIGTLLDTLV